MVVVVVIVVVVIVVVVIVVVVIVVVVVLVVVQMSGLYRSVMLGKTQFAKSSRGVEEALVVPCQNATSPFLKDFRRGEHKAIVFDEVSSECIHANKAVFQANSDTVVLRQSPCQAHIYQKYLYGVAMICCCNDWLANIHRGNQEEDWLLKNAIVYECTEQMWVE